MSSPKTQAVNPKSRNTLMVANTSLQVPSYKIEHHGPPKNPLLVDKAPIVRGILSKPRTLSMSHEVVEERPATISQEAGSRAGIPNSFLRSQDKKRREVKVWGCAFLVIEKN